MQSITPEHLSFVDEAAKKFEQNPRQETHRSEDGSFIALRYGMDRDCVLVYELGDQVANFVQQVDKRYPGVRKEVDWFAREMELQLRANELKGGWKKSSFDFLFEQLFKNASHLQGSISHSEFRRRCINVANFAMMLADNDRREEESMKCE